MDNYERQGGSWDIDPMDDVEISQSLDEDERYTDAVEEHEEHEHDQLPSVEQVRANAHIDGTVNPSNKQKILWKFLAFVILTISVAFGIFASRNSVLDKREAAALKYLQGSISDRESFLKSDSPQSRALRWMLYQDPLQLKVPEKGEDDSQFVQRYILAVFIIALVPSKVRPSLHLLTETHECDWNSIWKRSDGSTASMGIFCNDKQEVDRIILQTLGLSGEIPQETQLLEQLSMLALDSNHIHGEIPMISTLTHLSLAFNQFTGSLPDYLGRMPNLLHLSLSENLFEGRIPSAIESLPNLQFIAINGNELTGGIDSFFQLTSLEEIYMGFNSLSDSFSNASFNKLSNLRILDMNNNKLSGPLPDALWALENLEVVNFHFNALDGHINIKQLAEQHPIKYLDVSENFLGGGLPSSLNQLKQLTHLDVSSNRFEELLPLDLAALTNMETLLLSDNTQFGPQPIPQWLERMTNLKHLSLKLTARTGAIPDFFSDLTNLEMLDLDWNHITGTLASELGKLTGLKYLIMNRNWLEGTIPAEIAQLQKLVMLIVDDNRLVGELDACDVQFLISDCGNAELGCPDCESETVEVYCPCCTKCCYDGDEYCNSDNWIEQIEQEWREDYDRDSYYVFQAGETFQPGD